MRLSPRRRTLATSVLTGAAVAVAVIGLPSAPEAAANPPGPHDPFGAVWRVSSVADGVRFSGWALDPDALTSNVRVRVLVDGTRSVVSTSTSIARPHVTARYGAGPTPGFSITSPLGRGVHTACVVVRDIGRGVDTVLDCVATPLDTNLTGTQLAAHSPQGRIDAARARPASLRFRGWTTDPDDVARRATVVLYVDGSPAATVLTRRYPDPRPEGAGRRSAYDITVPVDTGTHIGCIWVVNVGIGDNAFLGCKARDTRGGPGTRPVDTPRLNKRVVREAKRHIGEPYVWGAEGPHRFDCSGLVMYSYGKFDFTTPRVSEDQAVAARLIPASRAVPGDLVFMHDQVGDVYHVGIYLSEGRTVAAIDEAHGVNYQTIWDPSSVTYGSFTHR